MVALVDFYVFIGFAMTTCSYIFFWVHFERNDVNLDQFYPRGISRSSSYHFSLNPFFLPLVGKPVDEL